MRPNAVDKRRMIHNAAKRLYLARILLLSVMFRPAGRNITDKMNFLPLERHHE
jgi:hypothetical protein